MKGNNAADARLLHAATVGIDYRDKDVSHKIQQLYGSSLEFDFAPYRGRVDLVFVDGAHHYAAARSDTENALRIVRAGGVILWHDFANYGDVNDVTRAIFDCIPASQVVQIANTQLALYRKPIATEPMGRRETPEPANRVPHRPTPPRARRLADKWSDVVENRVGSAAAPSCRGICQPRAIS